MSNGDDVDVNVDGITANVEVDANVADIVWDVFVEGLNAVSTLTLNPAKIGVGIKGTTAAVTGRANTGYTVNVGILGKVAFMGLFANEPDISYFRQWEGLVIRNYDRADLEAEVDFWAFLNPAFFKKPDDDQRA